MPLTICILCKVDVDSTLNMYELTLLTLYIIYVYLSMWYIIELMLIN